MFPSSVIIAGGKRRRDGPITPSRSVVATREGLSGVFRGSLRAKSPEARSQVSGRFDILNVSNLGQVCCSSSHVSHLISVCVSLLVRPGSIQVVPDRDKNCCSPILVAPPRQYYDFALQIHREQECLTAAHQHVI